MIDQSKWEFLWVIDAPMFEPTDGGGWTAVHHPFTRPTDEWKDRFDEEPGSALAYAYDIIVIDCPPALNMLTVNALVAADSVLVPMQCEYYALEGLSDLVNTIRKVQLNFNPQLSMLGLLRVMFDARITLAQQVSEQLAEHFGDKVFQTVIPRNVRLAEAPSHGMPGIVFDPSSRGAKAYTSFCAELLERLSTL